MRKHKTEGELQEKAKGYSGEIVIRRYENGSSIDTRRKATTPEREVLYNLFYGALLALNESEENRSLDIAARAIISCAEYTAKLFIPEMNGYDTVYIPLQEEVDTWEQEQE